MRVHDDAPGSDNITESPRHQRREGFCRCPADEPQRSRRNRYNRQQRKKRSRHGRCSRHGVFADPTSQALPTLIGRASAFAWSWLLNFGRGPTTRLLSLRYVGHTRLDSEIVPTPCSLAAEGAICAAGRSLANATVYFAQEQSTEKGPGVDGSAQGAPRGCMRR